MTYRYDSGGLLEHAEGSKCGKTYVYLDDMAYDEFGQRIYLKTGNGVTTEYSYFAKSRRLSSLYTANSDGSVFQNITYTYDAVGNITAMTNNDFEIKPRNTRTVTQYYQYDDLHRLVSAAGDYICKEKEVNKYTNSFSYDTIGNLTRKEQVNRLMHWPGHYSTIHNTTYTLDYRYKSPKPHAVTCDGTRSYSYDPNGNMTGVASHKGFFRRTMLWDEENRMISTWDNGSLTEYRYDDSGQRAIKRGKYGELTYVNSNFTIRNGETASKHVFAGNTRLATKMVRNTFSHGYPYGHGHNPWNYFNYPYFWNYPYYGGHSYTNYHWGHWYYGGYSYWNNYYHYKHKNEKSYWYTGGHGSKYNNSHSYYGTYGYTCHHNVCGKEVYYYHGDHLGSGNVISDSKGSMYEHIEYFPYGETWIDELYSQVDLPYKFTGKELDAETGLYYYGARYYEPVLSKWVSADPVIDNYFPQPQDFDTDHDHYWFVLNSKVNQLPGLGGVFNPVNLNLYHYARNNPVIYVDPDGSVTGVLELGTGSTLTSSSAGGPIVFAVAATAVLGYDVYVKSEGGKNFSNLPSGYAIIPALSVLMSIDKAQKEYDRYIQKQEEAKEEVDKKIGGVLEGKKEGKKTKGRTKQYEGEGGMEEAEKDFKKLSPTNVKPLDKGKGYSGELEDGRKVNVRENSTDSRPTLEIKKGKNRIKIRYNEK